MTLDKLIEEVREAVENNFGYTEVPEGYTDSGNRKYGVSDDDMLEFITEYLDKKQKITRQEDCPIGLDDEPKFCSAGTCDICRFERWYERNEEIFYQSHMDEKQIAYSAFLKGLEDGEL